MKTILSILWTKGIRRRTTIRKAIPSFIIFLFRFLRVRLLGVAFWCWRLSHEWVQKTDDENLESHTQYDIDFLEARRQGRNTVVCRWLRTNLMRVPYWKKGHLRYAERSFDDGDVAAAYASSLAVLELRPSDDEVRASKLLLGKCFVRKGELSRAVDTLQKIHAENTSHVEINETLAAAHMGLGENEKALELLSGIPESRRGGEMNAAIEYLKGEWKEG